MTPKSPEEKPVFSPGVGQAIGLTVLLATVVSTWVFLSSETVFGGLLKAFLAYVTTGGLAYLPICMIMVSLSSYDRHSRALRQQY